MPRPIIKTILLGFAAGALSTLLTIILIYLVGIVATQISSGDFFTTLFVAFTYLPLMVLLILLPLSLGISFITGAGLGIISKMADRYYGIVTGALIGVACAELSLTVIAPRLFHSEPGDFVNLIRNPLLSGVYGLVLGGLTGIFFRRLAVRDS